MLINNVDIHYERYNEKNKDTLVFLHGWGQNIEMMMPIAKSFIESHDVILVDLPGFGKSSNLQESWEVQNYVEALHELLSNLNVINPTLIGHSFGGKISLLYASKYKTNKLVLFGSPFKKEVEKVSLKLKTLKTLKKIPGISMFEEFAKKHIGSTDYRNASPILRETLVKTVNLDITEEVKKINAPTLLIWGTLDEAVDIKRAYELEQLIPDAGLIVYENATHYAYLENLGQTINIMKNFLN